MINQFCGFIRHFSPMETEPDINPFDKNKRAYKKHTQNDLVTFCIYTKKKN